MNENTTPIGENDSADGRDIFQRVTVEEGTIIIEFTANIDLDQINLSQPNGETFDQREITTGSQQVSF